MGIKHFFRWFKLNFESSITQLKKNQSLSFPLDNLLLDLNGIIHNSAQKIYKYGNHAPNSRLLGKPYIVYTSLKKQLELFEDICLCIEKLFLLTKPQKRLVIAIDGVAPLSKQNQQRQRRFKTSKENCTDDKKFDSNCISAGTQFMAHLSKYIDWFLRKKLSEDIRYEKIEVIFSNDRCEGEGEHKLLNFIRKYGDKEDSFMIYSADADLIMLALASHFPKFYLLRDETYTPDIEFNVVDIAYFSSQLIRKMEIDTAIDDFILICFMVGNDFLPNIPSIEIIENGIDIMLECYKQACLITKKGLTKNGCRFIRSTMKHFLKLIGQKETELFAKKVSHSQDFFPDPLAEAHYNSITGTFNIQSYKNEYNKLKFQDCKIKKVAHDYLSGLQWVFTYYIQGTKDWKWRYNHHYAPLASDIAKFVSSFSFTQAKETSPSLPFIQLLSILPPKSANLLPKPLDTLLTSPNSPLQPFLPKEFIIDLCGKRAEWEGVPILPFMDYSIVETAFDEIKNKIDEKDQKRNTSGKNYSYTFSNTHSSRFESYHGSFINRTVIKHLTL